MYILIKAFWSQNALSVFVCVRLLIRAVCSQCALVFSVLWLNNRSDVIQGQMREKRESELDGRRGRKKMQIDKGPSSTCVAWQAFLTSYDERSSTNDRFDGRN